MICIVYIDLDIYDLYCLYRYPFFLDGYLNLVLEL